MKRFLFATAALCMLSACGTRWTVDPNPQVVETDQGPITCLLYTEDLDWWDEAVSRPDTVHPQTAHDICRALGHRITSGNTDGVTWWLHSV